MTLAAAEKSVPIDDAPFIIGALVTFITAVVAWGVLWILDSEVRRVVDAARVEGLMQRLVRDSDAIQGAAGTAAVAAAFALMSHGSSTAVAIAVLGGAAIVVLVTFVLLRIPASLYSDKSLWFLTPLTVILLVANVIGIALVRIFG